MQPLPYFTADVPGIGGQIKLRAEDFFVQEVPAYEPSGEGEHVFVEIQKVGLTTFEAIHRVARAVGVNARDIGYAGLKDARAITRQMLSISGRGVTEERVMTTPVEGVQMLWAARHGNKLRLGHLRGNRFAVKIRGVNPTDVVRIRPLLDRLHARGMPNYFGEQRFGMRQDNHILGACLIRGRPEELLHHLLGDAREGIDDAATALARRAFDAGDLEGSMRHWPRRCGLERRVLARLIKTGQAGAAVRAVDEKLRRLWVSALQSYLFNAVVARRIESIDRLIPGDFAYKHDNGACFAVTDPAAEQPRCDAFEISPTGPMVGHRMTLPTDAALAIEQSVFKANGLTPGHFKQEGREQAKGTRRPLRVRPEAVDLAGGVDEHGAHVTVAFTLPAGSFATVLLREVMKVDLEAAAGAPTDTSTAPHNAIEGGGPDD